VPEARQAHFVAEFIRTLIQAEGKIESGHGLYYLRNIIFAIPLELQQDAVESGMSTNVAENGFIELP
jgi:hypothetical protein